MRKDLIQELEQAYLKHSRAFLVLFLITAFTFFIVQSYLAQPRSVEELIHDFWDLSLLFIPLIWTFWSGNVRNLLVFGIFYLAASLLMLFGFVTFIKPVYGTLFFICALWFLGDWFNTKRFGKSLFTELVRGNYYLALGIFISTLLVGSIIELVNTPFKIWWYNWPFPSLELNGLPVMMVAFGWLPWVLAMFVFLYPFALQQPKRRGK